MVSVGTYAVAVAIAVAVAVAYFTAQQISFEPQMPLLLVLLEIPAILVGILLAHGLSSQTRWSTVAHEAFLGKGIMLLLGGLVIAWISGPAGLSSIKPLFFDFFNGILAIFLLEMGLITSTQLASLRRYGWFLLGFGFIGGRNRIVSDLSGECILYSRTCRDAYIGTRSQSIVVSFSDTPIRCIK